MAGYSISDALSHADRNAPGPSSPSEPAPSGPPWRDMVNRLGLGKVAFVAVGVLAVVVTGWWWVLADDGRSAAAFCETMRAEKTRILGEFDEVESAAADSGDEFASAMISLGGSLSVLGELRTYFARLEEVAPDEIRPQVEIVRKATDEQFEAMGSVVSDPLGALGQGLMSSLTTAGQMEDVNQYALDNCGESI